MKGSLALTNMTEPSSFKPAVSLCLSRHAGEGLDEQVRLDRERGGTNLYLQPGGERQAQEHCGEDRLWEWVLPLVLINKWGSTRDMKSHLETKTTVFFQISPPPTSYCSLSLVKHWTCCTRHAYSCFNFTVGNTRLPWLHEILERLWKKNKNQGIEGFWRHRILFNFFLLNISKKGLMHVMSQ